tara:strand:- start:987 stop:2159 length:1173 start_codon:yes stop_codon:yes gene_type:complete
MLSKKLPALKNKIKFKTKIEKKLPNLINGYDKNLQKYLTEIEKFSISEWDLYRDLCNDYEFIGINKNQIEKLKKLTKVEIITILKFKPLTRAYFKLWEILHNFEFIPKNISCTNVCLMSSNLAEAPGGWINAIIDYEKKYNPNQLSKHKLIGISLKSSLKFNLKEHNYLKKFNQQIEINYGLGDGDLTNPKNILEYAKRFKNNKAHIVTADGGIGGDNYNDKEYLNSKLIFGEIIAALMVQKIDGNFVLKTYSLYTNLSIQLLNILQNYYQEVYITKPVTSRPANDELYLVCLKFKGINTAESNELIKILTTWNNLKSNQYLVSILESNQTIKEISNFNKKYTKIQIENLKKILNSQNMTQKEMKLQIDKMYKNAKDWYQKYNIKSNYNI